MYKPPRIELALWIDSFGIDDEWYDLDTKHEARPILTVGYNVGETTDYLYLATTFDPEGGTYSVAIAVYKPCIKHREVLAESGYYTESPTHDRSQRPT